MNMTETHRSADQCLGYPASRRDPAAGRTGVPPVPPGVPPGADARTVSGRLVCPHPAGMSWRPILRHRVGHPAGQAGRLFSPLICYSHPDFIP